MRLEREAAQERRPAERARLVLHDSRARLLPATLAARAGASSRFATAADMARYYAEHEEEFAPLPQEPAARAAAWQRFDLQIHQALAPEREAAHREAHCDLLSDLKASAIISAG